MRRFALLLALMLVIAACGDDDDTTAGTTSVAPDTSAAADTTTTTAASTTSTAETTTTVAETTTTAAAAPSGAHFVISSVTFGAPMLVITNIGDASGNLAGHWLCQRPFYQEIPAVDVGPGESVAISLGGDVFLPPPGAITVEQAMNIGGMNRADGEIGLYSSNAFGSSSDIVSYVEWGSAGHGRSGTAVQAGIWEDGAFVATTGETALIQLDSFDDLSPAGWSAS